MGKGLRSFVVVSVVVIRQWWRVALCDGFQAALYRGGFAVRSNQVGGGDGVRSDSDNGVVSGLVLEFLPAGEGMAEDEELGNIGGSDLVDRGEREPRSANVVGQVVRRCNV